MPLLCLLLQPVHRCADHADGWTGVVFSTVSCWLSASAVTHHASSRLPAHDPTCLVTQRPAALYPQSAGTLTIDADCWFTAELSAATQCMGMGIMRLITLPPNSVFQVVCSMTSSIICAVIASSLTDSRYPPLFGWPHKCDCAVLTKIQVMNSSIAVSALWCSSLVLITWHAVQTACWWKAAAWAYDSEAKQPQEHAAL